MISRRLFLALSGASFFAPHLLAATEEVPQALDHILLGCNDLDRGIAFIEQRTSIRAALGGVHPGRGTRDALLSLGARHYMEITAPDPNQNSVQPTAAHQLSVLKLSTTPRIVGWAVHPDSIEATAAKLREAGIAAGEILPGSRSAPDGHVLNWKTMTLADDRNGLLPFFIEWAPSSVHPSADAPAGCHIERFIIEGPNPKRLSDEFERRGIEVKTEPGKKLRLRAGFSGPKGSFEITS